MKIKEVIEKTGLTDRAIRLYIDEGLAVPSIAENYSGRKSIEFSESDVERLKNIALLRKAGFSIAEIKSLVDDKDTAKSIIENFIAKTEKNIAEETEILERLKNISFDEDVTLETICDSLSAAVEEIEVPSEDMKLTPKDIIKKIVAVIFACVQIVISVAFLVFICQDIFDFEFLKINPNGIAVLLLHCCWLVIIALSVYILYVNLGWKFRKNKKRNFKGVTTGAVTIIIIIGLTLAPLSFITGFFGLYPFRSYTTDPENYLVMDSDLKELDQLGYMNAFYKIFPRNIPLSAKKNYPDSVRYYYEFRGCWDWYIGSYDICAEWVLPPDEYEETVSELPGDFLLESSLSSISKIEKDEWKTDKMHEYYIDALMKSAIESNGYKIVEKGDWTAIYYINDIRFSNNKDFEKVECASEKKYEETGNEFDIGLWATDEYHVTYDLLICAYNDKEHKMRYIASQICGHERDKDGPYYLSLDW